MLTDYIKMVSEKPAFVMRILLIFILKQRLNRMKRFPKTKN